MGIGNMRHWSGQPAEDMYRSWFFITQFVLLIYLLTLTAIVQTWIATAPQASPDSRARPAVPVHSGAPTTERAIHGDP
jgi:hypothetical protein